MKIVGIITEYNPFHNGHKYHIQKAREITGADYVIAVMSGDFVQRGAPAVYHKSLRAHTALAHGADLVLELPSVYAVSSAEDFASGAIALLDSLKVVDFLCFGSECGSIKPLNTIADILLRESENYTTVLKESLKNGLTYPDARNKGLMAACPGEAALHELIASPNNILGIEYLKALKQQGSSIVPFTILREGKGYHDLSLDTPLGSASAIRQGLFKQQEDEMIKIQMPPEAWKLTKGHTPIWADDMSLLLNHTILSLVNAEIPLTSYLDISKELADRIVNQALEFCSFEERICRLKTKQYTYTRISRALLHMVLNIKQEDFLLYKKNGYVQYARVLGFRRSSLAVLTAIKEQGKIPLVTKTADARRLLSPIGSLMLRQDFYCSHIYQAIYQAKTGALPPNEFTQQVVIIE